MKKIIAVFLVSLFFCGMLCSCGQQNVNGQSVSSSSTNVQDTSTGNVPDYATLADPKDGKEAISIISFSSENVSEKYSYVYFTVRNDLEITVRNIYLGIVYLDKNGDIVDTGNTSENARVLPGQSIALDTPFLNSLNATAVYVDHYGYYDKDDNYHSFFVDNPEVFPIQ